jgi:nitrogenase molybdenum-iron protein alpha/beta subunit
VDCQAHLADVPVALAADGDLLGMLGRYLQDMGARIVAAVTSAHAPALAELPLAEVLVGDIEDLERLAGERGARLLVANSHGVEPAARLDVPLLRAGFPLYDTVGGHARTWIGYRGSRQALFEITNLLLTRRRDVPPYRSIFWQGTPRAQEAVSAAAPSIV